MIVMAALAIEARFELPKAADAAEMAVDHGHQLIPAAKAFAVLVRVVCRDQAVKTPSGQALQYFLHSAYPAHVAALVVELALRGLPRSTRDRNTVCVSSENIPDSSAPARE